jgi:hypothetical protein
MIVSKELAAKAEQSRRDGYIELSLSEGPILLSELIVMARSIFPNHSLEQLAITEVDDDNDTFVIAAQLGIETKGN